MEGEKKLVFTSVTFVFAFFPIVLIVYFIASKIDKMWLKNTILLIASYIFYIWGGLQYSILIIACTFLNYFAGLLLEKYENDKIKRKIVLVVSIVINVAVLGIFKYFNFFVGIIESIIVLFKPDYIMNAPIIPLPIGISFFTFQIMSYVIDVYRNNVKTQHNFVKLALYIMLFPQLIAGPIVRYIDVEKEINDRKVDLSNVYNGMIRFMVGFSKKMILANKMGYMADIIFEQVGTESFLLAWIGIISYSLHIFLDFSAYSDMAIGMGQIFGFKFGENFNYPYISESIQEFWRRWHISLSSWFKDYVYIPLGGSREGTAKTYINLSIVFILTGMWHGASWNFIVWGIFHGVFQILERIKLKEILNKLPIAIRHVYTLVIIMIGWVFFRADTLNDALIYIRTMFDFSNNTWRNIEVLQNVNREFIVYFIISILVCIPILQNKKCNNVIRDIVVVCGFALSLYYLFVSDFNPFIYFRF